MLVVKSYFSARRNLTFTLDNLKLSVDFMLNSNLYKPLSLLTTPISSTTCERHHYQWQGKLRIELKITWFKTDLQNNQLLCIMNFFNKLSDKQILDKFVESNH